MSPFEKMLEEATKAQPRGNWFYGHPKHVRADLRLSLNRAGDSLGEAHHMLDRHIKDLKADDGVDTKHHGYLLKTAHSHLGATKYHLDNARKAASALEEYGKPSKTFNAHLQYYLGKHKEELERFKKLVEAQNSR